MSGAEVGSLFAVPMFDGVPEAGGDDALESGVVADGFSPAPELELTGVELPNGELALDATAALGRALPSAVDAALALEPSRAAPSLQAAHTNAASQQQREVELLR